MKNLITNRKLLLTFRIVVGLVFIFAGIEKIADPDSFAESIENYKILPLAFVNFIAISIPWLELMTGMLLVFGISVKENSIIIGSLLILFVVLVASAVLRGLDIECGCFGTLDGQKVGLRKIAENIILLFMIISVFMFDKTPYKLD